MSFERFWTLPLVAAIEAQAAYDHTGPYDVGFNDKEREYWLKVMEAAINDKKRPHYERGRALVAIQAYELSGLSRWSDYTNEMPRGWYYLRKCYYLQRKYAIGPAHPGWFDFLAVAPEQISIVYDQTVAGNVAAMMAALRRIPVNLTENFADELAAQWRANPFADPEKIVAEAERLATPTKGKATLAAIFGYARDALTPKSEYEFTLTRSQAGGRVYLEIWSKKKKRTAIRAKDKRNGT